MRQFVLYKTKSFFDSSGNQICSGLIAILLYEYVFAPIKQHLPILPIFLYNFLVTALVLLFLLGLVIGTWKMLVGIRDYLVSRELRNELREKLRRWPASKWDLMGVMAVTWFLAVVTTVIALINIIPRDQMVGAMAPETVVIFIFGLLSPSLILGLLFLFRDTYKTCKDVRRQWVAGITKERLTLGATMSFFIVAYVVIASGNLAGWDHLLWFNGN